MFVKAPDTGCGLDLEANHSGTSLRRMVSESQACKQASSGHEMSRKHIETLRFIAPVYCPDEVNFQILKIHNVIHVSSAGSFPADFIIYLVFAVGRPVHGQGGRRPSSGHQIQIRRWIDGHMCHMMQRFDESSCPPDMPK